MKNDKKVKVMDVNITSTAEFSENPDTPLYGVVFHYNSHVELWFAILRENYVDYWNGLNKDLIGQGETLGDAYRNLCIKNYGK